MYRLFVITRHTFLEAILQPIYSLLIAIGAGILAIFGMLPFFTLGEDTIMFKSVGLDVILLLVLISTLFATSKSIFDEIEDRTMLTLMSKPLERWQVLVGKYLGIILSALMAIAILGVIHMLCIWWRLPGDYQLRTNALDSGEVRVISEMRWMHIHSLIPALLEMWMQISVLAAIGVALSTRFSLVVNLPTVIILYIAGNLTRFMFPLSTGPLAQSSPITKGFAYAISLVVPYLEPFDDRPRTVYALVAVPGFAYAHNSAVKLSQVWAYAGTASLYAICYVTFALAVGMWLFQSRELGGAEG